MITGFRRWRSAASSSQRLQAIMAGIGPRHINCAGVTSAGALMSEGCQDKLTVIIPAYNEEACIADSIRSLQSQTVPPDEIIVVDDCSSDRTGEVAASCGAHVLRPARNTGSKAGAQNFALAVVKNEYTLTIDADTTLAADAVEKLMPAIREDGVAAACGFVLPRYVRSLWERGRYIEYLFAFSYYKRIQDYALPHP